MKDESKSQSRNHSDEAEDGRDKSSADLGIVCTHSGEIRPLLKRLDRVRKYVDGKLTFRGGFLQEDLRIATVEAGAGFAAHRTATEVLIHEHRPAWVLSVGFSSALSPLLQKTDLTVAGEIVDTHGSIHPVKCPLPATKRVHVGRHVVADRRPVTVQEKRKLATLSGAIAVDISSGAVAQVCSERTVRFLSIRAIIDGVEEEIPEQAVPLIFDPGSKAIGGALATIIQGWRKAAVMNDWRTITRDAAEHLDRYVAGVMLRLGEKLRNQ
ncbi:MAG: hypothetical protein KDA96_02470 [Planctomycetaceae bacterium]|nr:hypothetical protein [Planctomycetaceae bacterium]